MLFEYQSSNMALHAGKFDHLTEEDNRNLVLQNKSENTMNMSLTRNIKRKCQHKRHSRNHESEIKKNKFLGHTMSKDSLEKLALSGELESKRNKEKQRITQRTCVNGWQKTNLTNREQ